MFLAFKASEIMNSFILYFRCIEMVETEFINEYNNKTHVIVGTCDSGPLSFTFQNNTHPSIWTDYAQMVTK